MRVSGATADETVAIQKEAERLTPFLKKRMKEQGKLRIPDLLEVRRQKYAIPPGAFKMAAVFDRVLLWQIPQTEGDTYGDTQIVMPDTYKQAVRDEAPRGVVVTAGMTAMDSLRSNGMEIGHVVNFIRQAPWRIIVDNIEGHDFQLLLMTAGDLTCSEDLQASILAGECFIKWNADTCQHEYLDKDGQLWNPQKPWIGVDY